MNDVKSTTHPRLYWRFGRQAYTPLGEGIGGIHFLILHNITF